jgi:hypothetical protein
VEIVGTAVDAGGSGMTRMAGFAGVASSAHAADIADKLTIATSRPDNASRRR